MAKVIAVGIKKLYYADPAKVTGDLTGTLLATIIKDVNTKQVENIHQDTWSIEEEEPSTTEYRNQLTNGVYRQDYETKAAFMGGTGSETSWKRARGVTRIEKCMIALTEDNQYCVFPKASVIARNTNNEGAVGIGVAAAALEPDNTAVSSEYWFDSSEVDVE